MRHSFPFIFVLGLLTACGTDNVSVDGLGSDDQADGIVGGSTFTGLPAVGSLTVDGSEYCTATLIGPRKVLTAAHCLADVTASSMRFVIGANISSPDYTLGIASLTIHPSYDPDNITNDVGVVTLSNNAPISGLPVLNSMDSSWVGRKLFFVGYGVTSAAANSGAGKKRAVSIALSGVNSKTFEYDDPSKNTCYGDSGGPAFYQDAAGNYLLAGITSYGDQNCAQYGVDTRADAFLSFIGVSGTAPSSGTTGGGTTGGDTGSSVVIKGVTLSAAQVTAILDLVNTASQDVLDNDVGLDSRAAANIVTKRPFATIQELAAVPYVGKTAIQKLKAYVSAN